MATATSWLMTARFELRGSGPYAGEIAQIGLRGRAGGAQYDQVGSLPSFDVQEGGEDESFGNFDISWAHWTPATGPGTLGVTQACMKDMVTALAAYVSASTSNISNAAYFTEARISLLDRYGKAIGRTSNKFVRKTGLQMTGNGLLPPQDAIAISTRSYRHGPRGHGRWYMPFPPPTGVDANGSILTAWRTSMANAAASYIAAVRDINTFAGASTDVTPAVVSTVRQDYADIIQIRVGNLWDTQRRRRNANPETYTVASV